MPPDDQDDAAQDSVLWHEAVKSLMVDHAPVIVGLVDTEHRLVDVGGALISPPQTREQFIGLRVDQLVADERIDELVRDGLAGEEGSLVSLINGRPWLVIVRPVRSGGAGDPESPITGVIAFLTFAGLEEVHENLSVSNATVEQFAALIELSRDFIATANLDGTITYLNKAGRELVGLHGDEEAIGRPTTDYFTESALTMAQEEFSSSLRAQGSWQGESTLRHFGTGEEIPVAVDAYLVTRPSDGERLGLATVQRDLRAEREAEHVIAMRIQEQRSVAELGRLALTMSLPELMDEAVRLINLRYPDLVTGVLKRHPHGRLAEMVACSVAEFRGDLSPVDDSSLTGHALLHDTVVCTADVTADPRFRRDVLAQAKYGMRSWLCCPIPGDVHPWGVVGASGVQVREWTEDDQTFIVSVAATLGAAVRRHELESQLQHQALHDPLTGLPNRALVTDRIDHALRRSARSEARLAVLLLDLDDFKVVNDSLGHAIGDSLLAELALRFEQTAREGDTVARLGGDEFVVVCEDVESEEEVAFVAERLLEACASGVLVEDRRLALSASVGVSIARGGQATPTTMLSEADIAMYRAKRDRPGTYRIFDEAMRGDVVGRLNLAGELRAAIRADELDVAFQPIVDLASGRVVAMEALARWQNTVSGESVPPDVFIPLAEETGLIGELGAAMLRAAAVQAAEWQQIGTIGLRVNASAHELRSHHYVDEVLDTLAKAGLPPSRLGVEITESTLVDEDRATQEALTRLRAAGVTLLIDDFGTGYSSLSYLQRFPVVDVLKIDRSFLEEGIGGKAVVEAIVALGRAFGLRVCAEGVETVEQHELVIELGCHFAQGYLLSRPVPAAQALELLAGWRPFTPRG